MITICNAFSPSMLEGSCKVSFQVVTLEQAKVWVKDIQDDGTRPVSAVGHADTAGLFSDLLGVNIAPCRVNVTLKKDDTLLVGQYVGPRLPEGTKELPQGAKVIWWIIVLSD